MTTMKKTHWLRNTLIVLIICGLIGSALAAVLFFKENSQTYASASLLFSFEGAAEGKAPNGYPFDVSGLASDEVLEQALEASELTGTYTAEQLRENLRVTGVYPERIAEQMTQYVSLLDASAGSQAAVTDYHATQYGVTLYNDFDRNISAGKLTGLLDNILTAYRGYFAKTYTASLEKKDPIDNLSEYDYAQQLEAVLETVRQQSRFAAEMQELAPDFLLDGKSFGDIAVRYQGLESDINRLDATITLNAVSKDQDRLKKRYEMEIRSQGFQLESMKEELKLIEEQVNSFDKDGIIYVSANGYLSKVGNETSNTYDKLVEKRKSVSDKIAEINATITLYQARLDDMTGAASVKTENESEDATAVEKLSKSELKELTETVETRIQGLIAKKTAVAADFAAMLDAYSAREINEKSVSVSGLKYKAPTLLSGAFIVKAIKTAGPICAVGFMVCMVLLILSRRKEYKAIQK